MLDEEKRYTLYKKVELPKIVYCFISPVVYL